MKANDRLLLISIMFLVFAIAFALIIWNDTSLAAILAFFAAGFGCGAAASVWFTRRGK